MKYVYGLALVCSVIYIIVISTFMIRVYAYSSELLPVTESIVTFIITLPREKSVWNIDEAKCYQEEWKMTPA